MSKSFIALTVVAVAAASAAVYTSQELRRERHQSGEMQARIAKLEAQLAARPNSASIAPSAAPETVVQQPKQQAESPNRVAALVTPSSVAPAVNATLSRAGAMDPEMRRRMQESHEQQMRMLKDPEYRELMRAQYRMSMQHTHSDLEALLGLSEHEREELLDVLAEQSLRSMEQRPAFAFDGSQPNESQLRERQRAFEEQRRKNESEIQAVLGSKYGEWQQYQRNSWSRSQVMNLRQSLSTTDEPLRQEQVKPLVDAIAREQSEVSRSTRVIAPGTVPDAQMHLSIAEERLQRTAQAHERIRAAASGLLTPTQYAQLERQQQQELKMYELSLKQQRARVEAQARGEIPPDAVNGQTNAFISVTQ